ncbi:MULTISPECIES: hydrogenase expression/formation protein [unclassified Pseudomonas]|uniref:hydrogenase expression/formation protein n=1 Tax=unclassified Pseudomonas TaxID=196821 RepID=UPI002AC9ADAD|nr:MULTISPECIES: hydrogenase expression/formation protein [unclassified Pseudomonas]MEB0041118.1 hydrogenase expression/formation protein [Pseudomonas sp. MH10]MEB0078565.1 hydrogenase expression/formation protein [Pseudomonas sp. MH10out]MEB0092135.1 hydrogenase expression/formation protein [Pseudomonas sp. CCI4.2]MEB0100380.1 hydrogenase expression/formation protein [Pseudomonas sp. CCI3.2]MEB0120302.1 hydrogenase expression/formation protein [Pseudomonas sp. CCI1.2]
MAPQMYIPLVDLGPGSQVEEEVLEYISMPQGMYTHSAPILPEPEELDELPGARQALQDLLHRLYACNRGEATESLDLSGLEVGDRTLLDQLLGEGEVSIMLVVEPPLRIQESIFAGVWRLYGEGQDYVEVGAAPAQLRSVARNAAQPAAFDIRSALPMGVMNAPAILTEIEDQTQHWQPGSPAHVINLTLLPLSEQDIGFLDVCLPVGPVRALARGYGNCRISSTLIHNCWRVTYFNSQDALILDTIEITDLPEVICAAPEDLSDSLERFEDVIQWFEGQ